MAESRADRLQRFRESEELRPMGEVREDRLGPGSRGGQPPQSRQASVVPRGTLRGLSSPQKVLFATWAVAIGLSSFQQVRTTADWPCPGPILKISGLYLILGVMSEFAPNLAAWLGVGFLIAYVTRQGTREIVNKGTFFGVPVKPSDVQAARAYWKTLPPGQR